MDSHMYIPTSIGITTLVSILAVVIGQIATLLGVRKLYRCCPEIAGAAALAEGKSGWLKASWEFVKLTFAKLKDKFKDKAADKLADSTIETVAEAADTVTPKA